MRPGREQVPLHRLAGKADIFTQCEAVSSLCYISELLQQRMPGVVAQDLSLMMLWSSSPAPAVSQRIPLMLAVLAFNAFNRERLSQIHGSMKTLIAAARAASKLKQLHALLAMAVCSRNRTLATQLVKLGAVDVLAAIVASREPGARPRVRKDSPKDSKLVLAAAIVLTQIAEWEEHRRHYGKLAFLRSVIALTRSGDTRIQLAGVSVLASLAQAASAAADLRESCAKRCICVSLVPNVARGLGFGVWGLDPCESFLVVNVARGCPLSAAVSWRLSAAVSWRLFLSPLYPVGSLILVLCGLCHPCCTLLSPCCTLLFLCRRLNPKP